MKRHVSFVAALSMCFFASITAADAQQIKADTGGIAIGGSVTGSTVIIGIPQEKVDELVRDAKRPLEELTTQQRENIALLKEKLDLNVNQVRAALGILGENDIPPERLAAKLVEIAERFRDLQATALAQPEDSPTIITLKAEGQKAIEAGELTKADALLADVETEQRRSLDRVAVNVSETSSRRGEIALTRLRYAEAANHFANAAGAFPAGSAHEDKRRDYLSRETDALFLQGQEFGDNNALRSAIERDRQLMDLNPRERMPLEWAKIQIKLGMALWVLGEREAGTAKLEEAVVSFREALEEMTRERVPLDWATGKNNLGVVLQSLGERESDTGKLEEAVVAYREALIERTRERVPLDWAETQNNLAGALVHLGSRGTGSAKLEEAVIAFREALKETTRERGPLRWAKVQSNLGSALVVLGDREVGTTKLEQAVVAFREALKERTRERVPLEWAATQYNLASALYSIGMRGGGAAKFEEAAVAFREALKEMTRDRGPIQWASVNLNLGVTLQALGKFDEAVAAHRKVLEVFTREDAPLYWATVQHNQGVLLLMIGARDSNTAKFEQAAAAFREALKERTVERVPLDRAVSLCGEGMALVMIAERRRAISMAESGLGQINAAFESLRDGGNAQTAGACEGMLSEARAAVMRLRGGTDQSAASQDRPANGKVGRRRGSSR
jgi:tetratricopeptide (TPR) repeat protein